MEEAQMKPYLGKLHIIICDKKWAVFFHNKKQYEALKIEGSRAVTLTRNKSIHFNCDDYYVGDNVAVHELVHAYTNELMGHDLNMDQHKFEEFFCTLFEMRGKDILEQGKKLTRHIAKHFKKSDTKSGGNDDKDE
jgi:hypothetical protein